MKKKIFITIIITFILVLISTTNVYAMQIFVKTLTGKNITLDYSAPNIAKPFHIGHLRSTVIGGALYNVYKFLNYNVTGVNHLGDYGTQFGKMIEGYKRWENEYNLEENPIDQCMDIYVRINNLCKEDENVPGVRRGCRH